MQTSKDLSATLLALSKLGCTDADLSLACAREFSVKEIRFASPQAVANVVHACAVMRLRDQVVVQGCIKAFSRFLRLQTAP